MKLNYLFVNGLLALAPGMFIPRLVTGAEAQAFTPWCPQPDAMTRKRVQAAVDERHRQLGVDCLPLLHLDWRDYTHPAYLDALEHLAGLRERGEIAHLGVANFDTDHLRLLLRHSVPIAANQVSFSLLDRRAAGRMSELCLSGGVKPPARGALAGGLLGERWLDQPDPTDVAAVSLVIRERFGPGRPTNTTLSATMALDACKVEIEVTAKRRVAWTS